MGGVRDRTGRDGCARALESAGGGWGVRGVGGAGGGFTFVTGETLKRPPPLNAPSANFMPLVHFKCSLKPQDIDVHFFF